MRASGDRAAFYKCRILSYQDTLFDDDGRHYYSNCYIEGATDFVCGNAASLYEETDLSLPNIGFHPQNTGFIFLVGKITGIGAAFLGRPWGAYSRVIFAQTYMSSVIVSQGWDDWQDQSKHSNIYYGEDKCYGPGADTSKRIQWSHRLSKDEAAPFLTQDMIGGRGWLRPAPTNFKRRSSTIATVVDENN
ncbi:hypothetical protein REPUB_Repub04eG0058000 [Reevesia pubescens]